MKVLVKVPISPYSGYGNDGLGIVRALIRRGADVYLDPTVVQAPIPADVAQLLTKELVAPFDLILNHVDPAALSTTPELQRSSGINLGWTMWEYSNLKNLRGYTKLAKAWKNFDVMVGYDEVSSGAMRPYFKGPLLTVQGGFLPENWPEVQRDWDEENFYFCMVGMLHERKDPFVAVQAFSELKSEHPDFDKHARLSLKTSTPGLHSKMEDVYPGLRIYYDVWDDKTMKLFYKEHHVLLAPSRGEGKNMPALEFMSTGGTVIATNWGGHRQWLSPEYAYPLDYSLESVNTDHPNTLNARASVENLKEHMLHAFRNRDEVRRKGELAAQIIPEMCSWDSVIERLLLQIKENVPGGDVLWMKAALDKPVSEDDRGDR